MAKPIMPKNRDTHNIEHAVVDAKGPNTAEHDDDRQEDVLGHSEHFDEKAHAKVLQ